MSMFMFPLQIWHPWCTDEEEKKIQNNDGDEDDDEVHVWSAIRKRGGEMAKDMINVVTHKYTVPH